MNTEEFRALLFETLGWANGVDDDYYGWGWIQGSLDRLDVSHIRVVDSREHTEGNWRTELYVVLEITSEDGTQYFKKSGYYASHDGAYWDGPLVEVYPGTKIITVWDEDSGNEYDSYDESY